MCHDWWGKRDWRAEGREVWEDFDREEPREGPRLVADDPPAEEHDADVVLEHAPRRVAGRL